ncbi:catechol 2,3-dioxygenase [Halopenitus malekzadehii]|uniref:Catechol 2,3-dioxygenase n=1 Tax=Halopenitus malekzadehii TaxID=1267564 RepID=A0A1H6JL14_9EURY|nr:VOC family protein [Halopenitus malekzadehii]SEH59719.1 catechol 2,3-dioxygenase [Halopenitus malekzadehii]
MNQDVFPQGTHIGRTALRVTNLGEVTDFYRDVVGLTVLEGSDTRSVLGVADTPLLVLDGDPTAPDRHQSSAGLYHTAFRVPSRAALGDALSRIRDNWQLGGASDHWVSEALYLTDPNGNGVEIYRDFPREEWPHNDDGSVRIGTEPLDLDAVDAAATGATRAPPETDIGHIHLEVSSLDAFRDFYIDTLGFEVQTAAPAASFVSASGYHHHIGANTWHRRTDPIAGRGLSWFEIVVPDGDALAAVRSRIEDRGSQVTETDDGLVVADPDAIEVRIRADPSTR